MQLKHKSSLKNCSRRQRESEKKISSLMFNVSVVINSIIYVIFVSSFSGLHENASNVNMCVWKL